MSSLLLFLDFEKAFDAVEWSFIWKTLDSFNFGPSIHYKLDQALLLKKESKLYFI